MFDGWGYAHLYRDGSGKLTEVGKPYAIPEGIDEHYAPDYGDLSIHEFATDPDENLAYASYYSGGLRVVSFGDGASRRTATTSTPPAATSGASSSSRPRGQRLIAASDRDFGLYIFRYTGPGAPRSRATRRRRRRRQPPAPPPAAGGEGRRRTRGSRCSPTRRQSLRTLRTRACTFRIRVDEASKLEVTLRGRFTSTLKRGARGKVRMLGRRGRSTSRRTRP